MKAADSIAKFRNSQPLRQGLAGALACLALIAGCSSGPAPLPNPEPELRQLNDTGYMPRRRHGTATLQENWGSHDSRIDVSVIAPSSAGDAPFPVVVYLPGLGEPATAGLLWRKAWAEAGYAVVSFQPGALSAEIWGSREARQGDFQALARHHYSATESLARLRTLDTVIAEIRRRANAGTAPFANTDASKIALAGFDLGAFTASVAAGERVSANARTRSPDIRALITLSPFFARNTPDTAARFAAFTLPVLAVTGTEDDDPFRLVRDPELRREPLQAMPAGAKYLLTLAGGSHTLLAGDGFYDTNVSREQADAEAAARRREEQRQQEPPSSQRRRRLGEWPVGPRLDPMNAEQRDRGERPRDESTLRRLPPAKVAPIPFSIRHIAAVTSVSTAFLDAHVRGEARARDWLTGQAPAWLGSAASLTQR